MDWYNLIGLGFSCGNYNSKIIDIKLEIEHNNSYLLKKHYYNYNDVTQNVIFVLDSSGFVDYRNYSCIYISDDKYKTQINGLWLISGNWSTDYCKYRSEVKFQISNNFSYLTYTHEEWEVRDLLL